jgi:hypothetical protein
MRGLFGKVVLIGLVAADNTIALQSKKLNNTQQR